MEKRKILDWVLNILLIIFVIVGIYLFLKRIFGSSPSDFQLILWLLGFFVSGMIKMGSLIYHLNREVGEFKVKSIGSFKLIRSDMNIMKNDIKDIKSKMGKRK